MSKYIIQCDVVELPNKVQEIGNLFREAEQASSEKRGKNSSVLRIDFLNTTAAVKRYPRDGRNRLQHEYSVLSSLPRGLRAFAPRPLARTAPNAPVEYAAYEWVDGVPIESSEPSAIPSILSYFRDFHSTAATMQASELLTVPKSLFNENSSVNGRYGISSQFLIVATQNDARLAEMRQIYEKVINTHGRASTPTVVCHSDSNPSNFLRTSKHTVAVDWDAGGLGDPAFEIAELSCHPTLSFRADGEWFEILKESYDQQISSEWLSRFIHYRRLITVWWCARMIRQEHEDPSSKRDSGKDRIIEMLAYLRDHVG